MIIQDIVNCLESFAPKALQENYDNSGLLLGDKNQECKGALCAIDINEDVLEEAIRLNANLIISHHPLIFQGIKSLTGQNPLEKILIKAIKKDIALYAAHTNFDNIPNGVNKKICDKIGLTNTSILSPLKNKLVKLVTFVPKEYANRVRSAIFEAGGGAMGNYDCYSYNLEGLGTFRPKEGANPHVGKIGNLHEEIETRIETILPAYLQSKVVRALVAAHPYEAVAYDIYPLENTLNNTGAGMIGELDNTLSLKSLLELLKKEFKAHGIRYTGEENKIVKRIAVCGGSGSFLLNNAIQSAADVFITGDMKYHQFFDYHNQLTIIDIGHFESEQFTKELFYEILTKKIPKFAVHLSEVKTNPIKYF